MSRAERKIQHLNHALALDPDFVNGFKDVQFVHQSIPEISHDEISLQTKIGELTLSSPIIINAMTGGGGEKTIEINRSLARVAKACEIPLALGSQMAAIKDQNEIKTYIVAREENPQGLIIANLGSEASVEQAKMAVEMVQANALQIHLNVIQELTMPEGDRDFKGTLFRIERIVKELPVPIIVKEVGFGISRETAAQLKSIGVSIIDVGGAGGTNFAEIENQRREKELRFFNDWGIKTAAAIVEVCTAEDNLSVISSGGLRDELDVAKSIALGASATAFAGRFLKTLIANGEQDLIEEIKAIEHNLKLIMTALGAKTIADLQRIPLILTGQTYHWLSERGIDTKKYSTR